MRPDFLQQHDTDIAIAQRESFDTIHTRVCSPNFSDSTETKLCLISHELKLISDMIFTINRKRD